MDDLNACPCGSRLDKQDCCLPLLHGDKKAKTAEALMRSRYTAYTLKNEAYLLKTWHAKTRPADLNLKSDPSIWQSLRILDCSKGLELDDEGTVEFIAAYQLNEIAQTLHETSRFIRDADTWLYLDGKIKPGTKPGRNDPCPCGSQKKFKKCCG